MWWKFVRTVSEKGRTLTAIFIPINTKNLIKNILFMKVHNLSTFLAGYIPALLLSGLKTGDLSYFNYSRQISGSLNEITNEKVSQTSFIKLSELAADQNNKEINKVKSKFKIKGIIIKYNNVKSVGYIVLVDEEILNKINFLKD